MHRPSLSNDTRPQPRPAVQKIARPWRRSPRLWKSNFRSDRSHARAIVRLDGFVDEGPAIIQKLTWLFNGLAPAALNSTSLAPLPKASSSVMSASSLLFNRAFHVRRPRAGHQ